MGSLEYTKRTMIKISVNANTIDLGIVEINRSEQDVCSSVFGNLRKKERNRRDIVSKESRVEARGRWATNGSWN